MNKTLLVLVLCAFLTSCENFTLNKENNNPFSDIEEEKKGVYDDLFMMGVNFRSIPYIRRGNSISFKYNVYALLSNFVALESEIGVSLTVYFYEVDGNGDKLKLTHESGNSRGLLSKEGYLIIPNSPQNFEKLSAELGEDMGGGKSMFFYEKTKTLYIFVNLPNYKGAVKIKSTF